MLSLNTAQGIIHQWEERNMIVKTMIKFNSVQNQVSVSKFRDINWGMAPREGWHMTKLQSVQFLSSQCINSNQMFHLNKLVRRSKQFLNWLKVLIIAKKLMLAETLSQNRRLLNKMLWSKVNLTIQKLRVFKLLPHRQQHRVKLWNIETQGTINYLQVSMLQEYRVI